jgi:hypothetical protein
MIKRLTFVRRGAHVSVDGFAAAWRAEALDRGGAVPAHLGVRRLVHCVVRPGRTERAYHGVAMEWFDDEAHLVAHDEAAVGRGGDGVVDEASMVRARVDSRTVFGADLLEQWWAEPDGASRLVLLGVLQARPGMSRLDFADYWWHQHRPLANRMLPSEVQPPIYVHDYVVPGEPTAFDGVGEFYDDAVDVARDRTRWSEGEHAAQIVEDEERFLVRETRYALITDAAVIVPG